MITPELVYRYILWGGMIALCLSLCLCLFRAILGPLFTDRVVAVNIVVTKSIILIALLSFILGETHLLDIAIVYAMIGFLAVVVLSKCYLLPHHINPADPDHVLHGTHTESGREKEEVAP